MLPARRFAAASIISAMHEVSISGPSQAVISRGQAVADVEVGDIDDGVLRAEEPGRFGRLGAFVERAGVVETDRERVQRHAALLASEREDDRRIEPAAEIATHGHFADQPSPHGIAQVAFELGGALGSDWRSGVPEPASGKSRSQYWRMLELAVFDDGVVAGRNLADACEAGPLVGGARRN